MLYESDCGSDGEDPQPGGKVPGKLPEPARGPGAAAEREPGEDPFVTAQRELKEETGAVPDTFLPMGVTLPSPGCLSERLYLFLAKGLHMESQQLDEDEFLNVERIPFNEMVHRVMDGEIEDSKTIAAVLKAKVLLNL